MTDKENEGCVLQFEMIYRKCAMAKPYIKKQVSTINSQSTNPDRIGDLTMYHEKLIKSIDIGL